MINFNFSSSQPNLVQSAQNLINNTVDQYIVRPLGNPDLTGISGFQFDILDDEEVLIESLITDNYVEKNISVQDHIALKPVRFTLRGYVAEITNSFQNDLADIFVATQALPTLGGLLPTFNPQDTQVYAKLSNIAQATQNVINQAKNLFSLFSNSSTNATRQQRGFQYFYQMWQTRQLCSVETPFAKFENMAIEHLRAVQSGATKEISDFTVTFKMIRTTSSVKLVNLPQIITALAQANFGTTSSAPNVVSGRVSTMTDPVTNLGVDNGVATDFAAVSGLLLNQSKTS